MSGDYAPRGNGYRRRGKPAAANRFLQSESDRGGFARPRRKCLVNSVNASRTSLETVLPIAKKYGAADCWPGAGRKRPPTTSEERLGFARTILNAALEAGIAREDVAIDCLTLTVSAQQDPGETDA